MTNTTIWTAIAPSHAMPPFGTTSASGLLIAGYAAVKRARNAQRGRPPRGELH